jgi:hypothetical protein
MGIIPTSSDHCLREQPADFAGRCLGGVVAVLRRSLERMHLVRGDADGDGFCEARN